MLGEQLRFFQELDREILLAALASGDPFARALEGIEFAERTYIAAFRGQELRVIASRPSIDLHGSQLGKRPILDPNKSLAGLALDGRTHELTSSDLSRVRLRTGDSKSTAALVIPIRNTPDAASRPLGALCLETSSANSFSEEEVQFSETLAGQVAIAFLVSKSLTCIRTIHEVTTALLSGQESPQQAYERILNVVLQLLDVDHGQIAAVDEGRLLIIASTHESDVGMALTAENSIVGQYLLGQRKRSLLLINDIPSDAAWSKYYLPLLGREEQLAMRSEVVVPLLEGEKLIGAFNAESPAPSAFPAFDVRLLQIFGTLVAQTIMSATHSEEAARKAKQAEADFAFAELGAVAATWVHRFGNLLGNAKTRLFELKKYVKGSEAARLDGLEPAAFVESILVSLRQGVQECTAFKQKFRPMQARFRPQELEICPLIERAAEKEIKKPHEFVFPRPSIETRCVATEQLEEVFGGLFANAVDAMPDGGKIYVEVGHGALGRLRVSVRNDGPNISPENSERVFEHGWSTKGGMTAGRGMGLWWSRLYMQRLRGEIWLEPPSLGGFQGPCFVVEVPRAGALGLE